MKKISFSDLYQVLLNKLLGTWNVSNAVQQFYEDRKGTILDPLNSTIELGSDEEWTPFHAIRLLLASKAKQYDWLALLAQRI